MTDYFKLSIPRDGLLSLSTLGLAHLGDGVYELMVRSWLVLHGKAKAKDLHRATVQYVAAPAQAERFERNTAPHSIPKAASRAQYQTATGLEALFGWLYLQGRTERLNELFSVMMEE